MRTMDLDLLGEQLTGAFSKNGYTPELFICPGQEMLATFEKVAKSKKTDIIIACGGDGTISAAAGIAWKHKKTLGVLPGGTMNLYARALGGPLELEAAGQHLAEGTIQPADIATANGRAFVHQFSVGLHPRIIEARSAYDYDSRFGKMLAGIRAAIDSFSKPPTLQARIETDSNTEESRFSLISVSNNLFGEGHLPYPDKVDQAVLGLYTAGPLSAGEATRLASDLALGNWTQNTAFHVRSEKGPVRLTFETLKRNSRATIDGELVPLKKHVTIELHKGELSILMPKPAEPNSLLG